MDEVLRAVAAQMAARGEALSPPATPHRIEAARAALRDAFGAALSADHAAVLERMDGLDVDGLVLYGTWQSWAAPETRGGAPGVPFWQGLVEMNRLWRDGPGLDGCLVLGETDMDLLTVDLDGRGPVLRDKVTAEEVERFATLEAAIVALLARRL